MTDKVSLYESAVQAGHTVMMMFGDMTPYRSFPNVDGSPNADWVPWDSERYKAAKAAGERVTVNVQIRSHAT